MSSSPSVAEPLELLLLFISHSFREEMILMVLRRGYLCAAAI